MDTNSDEQFLFIEATIGAHKQEADKNQVNSDDKLALLSFCSSVCKSPYFFTNS